MLNSFIGLHLQKDEEPLAEDELPEHLRPPPQIDFSKLDTSNPENILKLSKKGKSLMMFVTINGNPTKDELESITSLWHSALFNMHLETQRCARAKIIGHHLT